MILIIEALIIAAGDGSRLYNYFSPKPLLKIFGLYLLERIILSSKRAGIHNFKIVIGYKGLKIKKAIGDGRKYGVHIEYISNPEWRKGNGVSVLKAKEHMSGQFLLLMCDHIFDESILKKLLAVDLQDGQCVLCVDRAISGDHIIVDDATKVKSTDGKVKRIGKELKKYDAIDTGIFLCTPKLFDALEKSVARGQYSLSSGNQILAEQGRLRILDVTGHFWVDVDDRAAFKKAQNVLLQHLMKATDGPISRTVNRKFSTKISAVLTRYNISPNFLTLMSFALAALSGALFFLGGYLRIAIAGLMAQLSSVLDGCDGEVARLKFKSSRFGKWLDRILDRYADGLIILGMTRASWISTSNEVVWLVGFFALAGTFMNSYTAIPYDQILEKNAWLRKSIRMGRDVRLFIIFLGAIFNQLFATLILLAIVMNLESIRRLFVLNQVYRFEDGN